jgi:hypothetical protein
MNKKPNIITPFNDKQRFKDLVLNVISDSAIYVLNPDVITLNGSKEWWQNGRRHRKDGPAIERSDGHEEWWIEGIMHLRNK